MGSRNTTHYKHGPGLLLDKTGCVIDTVGYCNPGQTVENVSKNYQCFLTQQVQQQVDCREPMNWCCDGLSAQCFEPDLFVPFMKPFSTYIPQPFETPIYPPCAMPRPLPCANQEFLMPFSNFCRQTYPLIQNDPSIFPQVITPFAQMMLPQSQVLPSQTIAPQAHAFTQFNPPPVAAQPALTSFGQFNSALTQYNPTAPSNFQLNQTSFNSNLNNLLTTNQFNMPTSTQFNMPPSNQFNMPPSNQFNMPPSTQFNMAPSNQFNLPPTNQFNMPPSNQFNISHPALTQKLSPPSSFFVQTAQPAALPPPPSQQQQQQQQQQTQVIPFMQTPFNPTAFNQLQQNNQQKILSKPPSSFLPYNLSPLQPQQFQQFQPFQQQSQAPQQAFFPPAFSSFNTNFPSFPSNMPAITSNNMTNSLLEHLSQIMVQPPSSLFQNQHAPLPNLHKQLVDNQLNLANFKPIPIQHQHQSNQQQSIQYLISPNNESRNTQPFEQQGIPNIASNLNNVRDSLGPRPMQSFDTNSFSNPFMSLHSLVAVQQPMNEPFAQSIEFLMNS